MLRGGIADLVHEEKAHALAADVIFALDTSKGVGEEIAKYSDSPAVRQKLIVLSPRRYKNARGFPAAVRKALAVEWYSEEDFRSCRLAKETCVKHVQALMLDRIAAMGRY